MAAGATTPPVFLVDELPAGTHGELTGEEARHAATVRRMRAGERLVLSDGAGNLAGCTITGVRSGRDATIEVSVDDRRSDPPPALRVTVAQALVKGDRGELAVELATEAGADVLVPWRAARSVAKWDEGPRGAKALARWRSTVRSAAKQARRSRVPEVTEPAGTARLAERIRSAAGAVLLDGAAECGLADLDLPAGGEFVVVVGPEGGIAPEEFDVLIAAGARPVRLGPTVLRTSTAAAVTLGALGVLTDRWR